MVASQAEPRPICSEVLLDVRQGKGAVVDVRDGDGARERVRSAQRLSQAVIIKRGAATRVGEATQWEGRPAGAAIKIHTSCVDVSTVDARASGVNETRPGIEQRCSCKRHRIDIAQTARIIPKLEPFSKAPIGEAQEVAIKAG